MSHSVYAGVELGGTKCVAILARGPEDIIERKVVPTTAPEATLGPIEAILRIWCLAHRFDALGIASFGPVDLDQQSASYGQIVRTTKPGWSGTDVALRLERACGVPTGFDTDVNGAALAEMRWGAGRGMEDFAYITVGTGIGVGLIVNGKPTRGFAHSELGHIRTTRLAGDEFAGCCPYHRDCAEGLASGTALKARLGNRSFEEVPDNDSVWEEVGWTLAQLCHVIVCAAAPRTIALGGGVMDRQPHLVGRVNRMLEQSLNGYMLLPGGGSYVRPPELGSNAGPLGSIALAMSAASA
ncbi:MAG TPA: ROK family protein [Sphingomicrobium sp.]